MVWEGSAFAESLAEALAEEEASSQPAEASLPLETPPDAAAARLLAGLEPERVDERKDEMVGSESVKKSNVRGTGWVAAMQGITGSTVRSAAIKAYVQQCKQLVQASKFGSRADPHLNPSASAPRDPGSVADALPSSEFRETGTADVQISCGREQEWMDGGRLAGCACWLIAAAAATVVPLRLFDSDRPRLAGAVGLTSLPVLGLAACRLHGKTADARLTLLLQRNRDALDRSIDCMTRCASAGPLACFASA